MKTNVKNSQGWIRLECFFVILVMMLTIEGSLGWGGKARSQSEEIAASRSAESSDSKDTGPADSASDKPDPKAGDISVVNICQGVKLEMVWMPAGSFLMGSPSTEVEREVEQKRALSTHAKDALFGDRSPSTEVDRNKIEGPQTQVTLDGFWMGKYEVTQAQYEAIMETNPSTIKGGSYPVEKVVLADAMEFCKRLSQLTGDNYTVPSEAQWEYACRAGTTTAYYFGDDKSQLWLYAWYGTYGDYYTHQVGQKKPNAWGLYDMYGNVWEWCTSLYYPYPYVETDGRNDLSIPDKQRVLRGGGWSSDLQQAILFRSAFRSTYSNLTCSSTSYGYGPYNITSYSYPVCGFRCARTR